MRVLGYFVNVRDQSFLATVFKNILQGRWSIKQANTACRNKAMNTKLATALPFNLEEYALVTWKSICATSGMDLSTIVSLKRIKDLVEEIRGCIHVLLRSFKHAATCAAGRWHKTFPTGVSVCLLSDE